MLLDMQHVTKERGFFIIIYEQHPHVMTSGHFELLTK
jgi:hypothetical protein